MMKKELNKDEDIKRLVGLIDPDSQNVEWLKQLFRDATRVEKKDWHRFTDEMDFNVVAALYYPIYNKYFSHDEIKELIEFYSSVAGRKLARYKSCNIQVQFASDELEEIEQFKKTRTGKKYNSLLDKITSQHVELVKEYIGSLK